MELKEIIFFLKRLYRNYVKKRIKYIFIALILSILVAGTTSATAWLLDPAIKRIFIEGNKTYAALIPILIVVVFATKGVSLYFARVIVIEFGNRIIEEIQNEMADHILISDTQNLESKHSGRYISSFLYDVGQIQALVKRLLIYYHRYK